MGSPAPQARARRSSVVVPFLDAPLPTHVPATIELADLHAVLARPVRAFVERRLGARFPRDDDPARSILPVVASGLDTWAIGDDLLGSPARGRVRPTSGSGSSGDAAASRPACSATGRSRRPSPRSKRMVEAATARGVRLGVPVRVPVDLVLPDGTRLVGSIDDRLDENTPGPVRIQFTRPKSHHQLASWLDLMVLTAIDPDRAWRALSIHRAESGKAAGAPPTVDDLVVAAERPDDRRDLALHALGVAVDCHRRAFAEPLPLFRHLSPELAAGTSKPDRLGRGVLPQLRRRSPRSGGRAHVRRPRLPLGPRHPAPRRRSRRTERSSRDVCPVPVGHRHALARAVRRGRDVTAADAPFSVFGDLPIGRTAIEASAGTGKTYTLAALTTRLVAERDVAAGELLIVTFTRAATAELRSRVRERLAGAAAHLASEEPPAVDDDVLTLLAAVEPVERRKRAARLARAVSEFDSATITTIHGFATQVLGTLGAASGADRDATLVDDEVDLTSETCADVLAAAATARTPGRRPAQLPDPGVDHPDRAPLARPRSRPCA